MIWGGPRTSPYWTFWPHSCSAQRHCARAVTSSGKIRLSGSGQPDHCGLVGPVQLVKRSHHGRKSALPAPPPRRGHHWVHSSQCVPDSNPPQQITAVQSEFASSHVYTEMRSSDLPTLSRRRQIKATRGTSSTWFRRTSTSPRAKPARLRGVKYQKAVSVWLSSVQ